MRWILLLLLVTPASAAQKDFTMRFYGAFLEPGLGANPAVPGDEIETAEVSWTSPTEGRLTFTEWRLGAAAEFTVTPDRRTLLSLRTTLDAEPEGRLMSVWRMRHGYRREADGRYTWTSLDDVPPPLDTATGQVYDRFLRGVWRLWVERKVKSLLTGGSFAPGAADPGQFERTIVLNYGRGGMQGTPTLRFAYRYWHMPVNAEFKIAPKKPTEHDPTIITITGPVRSEGDAAEMRRRHGFHKSLMGYSLDKDFPDASFPMKEYGGKIDDLLGAGQAYWAEAAAYIITGGLDNQLQEAISKLPAPAERPAFTSLHRLASEPRW